MDGSNGLTHATTGARGAQPTRSARVLVGVCAGLALAAALLWGASAVAGSSAFTGVALLALAGVAGVAATAGVLRRLVGALLAVAGLAVAGLVAAGFAAGAGAPLAMAGGAVLLAAGGLVAWREPRLPRLGSRYAAPGDRRAPRDPDRAAWEALDAGADPTVDSPEESQDGTDGGHRTGRG